MFNRICLQVPAAILQASEITQKDMDYLKLILTLQSVLDGAIIMVILINMMGQVSALRAAIILNIDRCPPLLLIEEPWFYC